MKKSVSQRTKASLAVFTGFIVLALLLAIGAVAGGEDALIGDTVSTAEDRMNFLLDCGWETDPHSETIQDIHIPERFTAVYENYNELQISQGYNLTDYAGQDCTLYSYTVLNYPDENQTVIADLYVYKNRIIGGDVHSTNLNGFMIALK